MKTFRRDINLASAMLFIPVGCSWVLDFILTELYFFGPKMDPFWVYVFGVNMAYMPMYAVTILCLLTYYAPIKWREVFRTSKGNAVPKILSVFVFMGGMIVINLFCNYLMVFLEEILHFPVADWDAGMVDPVTVGEKVAYVFLLTVMPAVFEEAVFRGAILGVLKRWNRKAALGISALFFALFHQTVEQIPYAFLLGLLLGYFALRYDSVVLPMVMHFCANLFSAVFNLTVVPLFDREETVALGTALDNGLTVSIVALGVIALVLLILWEKRRPKEPVAPPLVSGISAWKATLSSLVLWGVVAFYSLWTLLMNALKMIGS